MASRSRTYRNMISAVLFMSIILMCGSVSADDDREVTIRFSLEEGTVLKYKGSTTTEMNWKGIAFSTVHGDEVEMSWMEQLEDGKQRVEIKYISCSDRRAMGGAAAMDFDAPVKPEGRAVKVVVGADGRPTEVAGFILGIKGSEALKGYVNNWFFDLPEGPVKKGSTWTVNVPREDEEKDEEKEFVSDVKGTIDLELKKFDKKNDIEVAVIKFKGKLNIHNESEQGVMDGEAKSDGEVMVALDGGYIVEYKNSSEMKGKLVSLDELSGKESSSDVVQVRNTEKKLQK
ncbi:MAG: hypothetical protein KAV42_03295 [Candidatus Krumholzibacteria bacterium]|nr:hypothetical protein [Candidatus Krumholzibacteria bacterium]